MRQKNHPLGQFPTGCPPFDKEGYGQVMKEARTIARAKAANRNWRVPARRGDAALDGRGLATVRSKTLTARYDLRRKPAVKCAFCEIVNKIGLGIRRMGRRLSTRSAFLDLRPLFPGHVLLVPKRHVETLAELPGEC